MIITLLLQTVSEGTDLLSRLAEFSTAGLAIIAVFGVVVLMRRTNGQSTNGQIGQTVAVVAQLQGAITAMVADQATITATQGRIVDGQRDIVGHLDDLSQRMEGLAKSTDRLVNLHVQIEENMARLEASVLKGESG